MSNNTDIFRSLQITRKPLYEQVADRMQETIAANQLQPGMQLPTERELAEQFGINRTTVHQALGLLQQRGIVEMKVGSGTYVINMPNSVVADSIKRYFVFGNCTVDDIIKLRAILEPGLAALAAERATDADVAELGQLIGRSEQLFAGGNLVAYAAADAAFHETLAAATHNELIVAISAALHHLMDDWLNAGGRSHLLVDSPSSHRAVYEAVASQDPQKAQAAMETHLRLAGEALLRVPAAQPKPDARTRNDQRVSYKELPIMSDYLSAYPLLAEQLASRGLNVEAIKVALKAQHIETHSWGYANSGTRFKVFPWLGAARTIHEKLQDAALVHRLTGVTPTVAIHIPWDGAPDSDWAAVAHYATELGVKIGAVNPNLFQDASYRLGSVCSPDPAVRRHAIAHMLECIEVLKAVGSDTYSLWFGDGTNYAGQDDIRTRKHRMQDALAEVYAALPAGVRMLVEYKFFEPAFYYTDISDWGASYALCMKLGPQAQVLVDTGHHAQGTNIEGIVAWLLDEGRLGGFHFNSRKYADDDLMVGSVNPFELFCIYNELVAAAQSADPAVAACARNVAYMIDQSHNIEGKVDAMIASILNCQTAYAKALLVDRAALAQAQAAGDVLAAHRVLVDAYETDVRPLLAQARVEMGRDPDPMAAFRSGGYAAKLTRERGSQAGGGGYALA